VEHGRAQHRADALAEHGVAHRGRRGQRRGPVVRQHDGPAGRDDDAAHAVAERQAHLHEGLRRRADGDLHLERPGLLVHQAEPREVRAEQVAGAADDEAEGLVDVLLGGLDLHADVQERLVVVRAPRLGLRALDEQREVRREDRHEQAPVARARRSAQGRDERAADPPGGVEHGLDPARGQHAQRRGVAAVAARAALGRRHPRAGHAARAVRGDAAAGHHGELGAARGCPDERAEVGLQDRAGGLERRPGELDRNDLLAGVRGRRALRAARPDLHRPEPHRMTLTRDGRHDNVSRVGRSSEEAASLSSARPSPRGVEDAHEHRHPGRAARRAGGRRRAGRRPAVHG
jgi:hypothetical protein